MKQVVKEQEQGTMIPFDSFYYKGITPIGSCTDWKTFTETKLTLPYDNIFFSKATLVSMWEDFDTETSYEESSVCDNAGEVTKMIESLESGLSYEFNCDGRSWRVFTCNGERVMCLNCKENCVETVSCPGTAHIVNPCMDQPKCNTRSAASVMVSFEYAFVPYYPKFNSQLYLISYKNSIDLSVNVDKPGTVYCAAFLTGTTFSSLTKIREAGFQGYIEAAGFVNVT